MVASHLYGPNYSNSTIHSSTASSTAKIITLMWQAMLKAWKLQNDHLHLGNPDQEDCSQLQAAVNQIFFEAQQDPQLQAMIKNLDPNQIMSHPTCHIRQWVFHNHIHMQAPTKVVKLQLASKPTIYVNTFHSMHQHPHK